MNDLALWAGFLIGATYALGQPGCTWKSVLGLAILGAIAGAVAQDLVGFDWGDGSEPATRYG